MINGIMKSIQTLGGTIQTAEIDADAIDGTKIADDAVGSEHIEDLSADLTFADGVDIVVNTSTGTKIGTATGQKIALHNATPVVQAAHIADATDLADALTRINAILVVLENKGLTAAS